MNERPFILLLSAEDRQRPIYPADVAEWSATGDRGMKGDDARSRVAHWLTCGVQVIRANRRSWLVMSSSWTGLT
jgi:hypothetical protein